MIITFTLLLLVCLVSSVLLRRNLPGGIVIEPGFLLITILLVVSVTSTVAHGVYGEDINMPYWTLWKEGMLEGVHKLTIVFIIAFTLFYLSLIFLFENRKTVIYERNQNKFYSFYSLNVWIPVTIITIAISYTLQILSLTYLNVYYSIVVDLSLSALYAALLLKLKTKKSIIISSLIFAGVLMFIYHPFMSGGAYTVNKGGVIKLLVFGMVLVELIKYRGRSIKVTTFYAGIVFIILLAGAANYIEALVNGSDVNTDDFVKYVLSGLEWRMLENTAIIMDAVTTDKTDFIYGESYYSAINEVVFPYQNNLQLSEWILQFIPGAAGGTARYGFSSIAEGYINYGYIGVIISGAISALLIYMIRYALFINSRFSPLFYGAAIVLPYYIYRTDLLFAIKKVELILIAIGVLAIIYHLLRVICLTQDQKADL